MQTTQDYKYLLLTIILTVFFSWSLQEIFDHAFHFLPRIISLQELESMAKGKPNHDQYLIINKRLTKSMDSKGNYRMQTRASVYFVKSIYCFLGLMSFLITFCSNEWFVDHFINLKQETTHNMPYLYVVACTVGFYSWEVASNRYGKLEWSILIHHWFTVGITMAILFGVYSPFATWYGFCMVFMVFPVYFSLGFRAQFSYKYPELTRNIFLFCYYWYIICIVINLMGQSCIILNSLIWHFNKPIHIGFIVVMLILMAAWLYDDILLLKTLKAFSLLNYEDADVLKEVTSVRNKSCTQQTKDSTEVLSTNMEKEEVVELL